MAYSRTASISHSHHFVQPPFRTATLTPLNKKWSIHSLGYPWFERFGAPPFDTTMGLVEADLGSWCAREHGHFFYPSTSPTSGSPMISSQRAFCTGMRAFCTGGLDPRDLKQRYSANPFYGWAKCRPIGRIHNLTDLTGPGPGAWVELGVFARRGWSQDEWDHPKPVPSSRGGFLPPQATETASDVCQTLRTWPKLILPEK